MLVRCPGCGKEIDEALDVCPHCKRDFTVAVQGTGRRVGPAGDQPNKQAPPPQNKTPQTAAPAPKKPAQQPPAQKAPPPPQDDLPAFMKADLGPEPTDEEGFVSPEALQAKSAASGDSLDDLPAHMRADIEAPPGGSMDDLPAHMRADIEAPPGGGMDDSVLPPHMRGDALDSFTPRAPVQDKGNPMTWVAIGAVFFCGFLLSKVMGGKEKPAPPPAVKIAESPDLPDPSQETVSEEEEAAQKEATAENKTAEEEAKSKLPKLDLDAPKIEESPAPVIVEEVKAPPRSKRRSRGVSRVPDGPAGDINPKASAPKFDKWRFRSHIYNLVTLAPVSDANIAIYDLASGQRFPTATGPDGSFRKTVPANANGYKLLIQHAEYETKYLPGNAHPFQSMDEDERTEIAKKLKQFTPALEPIRGDSTGKITERFYLLPREKHGMSLEEALDR